MKILGILLLILSGGGVVLAISVVRDTVDAGVATLFGAFAIPLLLGWWGTIALSRSRVHGLREGIPHPSTHIRCPDCKELVLKEAPVCKHCGCKLVPQK